MENRLVLQLAHEYENQLILYKNIHETAEKLHRLCSDADFSKPESITFLNELIALRQSRMQDIEISRQTVASLFAELKPHLDPAEIKIAELARRYPSPETGSLERQIRLLKLLLEEIACLDAANRLLLQQRLHSLKQEAIKLKRGKFACQAYKATTEQHEGFFIDAKHF